MERPHDDPKRLDVGSRQAKPDLAGLPGARISLDISYAVGHKSEPVADTPDVSQRRWDRQKQNRSKRNLK
jgi:hypothetical protein